METEITTTVMLLAGKKATAEAADDVTELEDLCEEDENPVKVPTLLQNNHQIFVNKFKFLSLPSDYIQSNYGLIFSKKIVHIRTFAIFSGISFLLREVSQAIHSWSCMDEDASSFLMRSADASFKEYVHCIIPRGEQHKRFVQKKRIRIEQTVKKPKSSIKLECLRSVINKLFDTKIIPGI